ncbi:Catechol 2,3-dioxygenase [Tangfeifania diversioriginum]|uniref:Catechol 2,3-dioxygenase n=1 Tax=Tangfeifania diversioriginum TaxID=1168035 RepID=A0A1M6BVK8_9BACT|nr:VOC family protein [Tangfeifania diversioriginum]SHI52554.1 Catechol 2,3-dioxygenase [Tangfeifania diversioriginum]
MKNLFTAIILFFVSTHMNAQMAPAPEEFNHSGISIGVVVSDLDKSLDFYTNVIGMTQTGAFGVNGENAKELGLSDGRSLDVKILKLKDSPQASEWKLMSFGEKANHPKQNYIHDDTGMQYITLFVTNIAPFLERMNNHNVEILSKKPSTLDDGRKFILVQDPDGTFIEIIGSN